MKHHRSYTLMCLIIEFPLLTHVHLSRITPVVLGKPPEDHVSHHTFFSEHPWLSQVLSFWLAKAYEAYPNHNVKLNCLLICRSLRIVRSLKDENSGLFVSLCSIYVLWMTYNLWVLPYMLPDGLTPSALSKLS